MSTTDVSIKAAQGADKCMHAALHLIGLHWPGLDYDDPRVLQSDDPAIVMLLGRYRFLLRVIRYAWAVENTNADRP